MQTINDIVQWRLCVGCGACEYICPQKKIRLMDFLGEGIRPVADTDSCRDCQACLDVCPSVQSDFHFPAGNVVPVDFEKEWGPITGIWEGHASDPEIRDKGSSGGALTALAAYCLEKSGMHGVLHTAQDPEDPILNRTRLSRTRADLVAATGSRYSPGSVGNGLGLVESAPASCVIIGKPSEIAAVQNARKMRPALDQKIGVTLSFFCAESPSTLGTVALLKNMGVDPAAMHDLRYRGFGWPGHFAPTRAGETEPCGKMTYAESWAFLQRYRPWSVHLWPDGSGELADISCGDPWYEKPDGKNPGSSLVVARSIRGREIVEGAIAAGYLQLQPAENWKLAKSQPGLLTKKGAIWGRRLAMRLLGVPVTKFPGLALNHCWKPLSFAEKSRAFFGTFRRALQRSLFRRARPPGATEMVPVKPAVFAENLPRKPGATANDGAPLLPPNRPAQS